MSLTQRRERATRYRKRVVVQFGVAQLMSGGFTTNVSAWGLSLSAPSLHLPGTSLQLTARLGDGQVASLTARVTWARRGSAALGVHHAMGLQVVTADQAWFLFVARLERQGQQPTPRPVVRVDASRRVLGRHAVDWPVRLGLGARLDRRGQTIDVSAMGLSLWSTLEVSVGTRLFLEVILPSGSAVKCEGQVLRTLHGQAVEAGSASMAVRLTRADELWYRELLGLERAAKGA